MIVLICVIGLKQREKRCGCSSHSPICMPSSFQTNPRRSFLPPPRISHLSVFALTPYTQHSPPPDIETFYACKSPSKVCLLHSRLTLPIKFATCILFTVNGDQVGTHRCVKSEIQIQERINQSSVRVCLFLYLFRFMSSCLLGSSSRCSSSLSSEPSRTPRHSSATSGSRPTATSPPPAASGLCCRAYWHARCQADGYCFTLRGFAQAD